MAFRISATGKPDDIVGAETSSVGFRTDRACLALDKVELALCRSIREIYGEGEPLVLIHGGLTTIGEMTRDRRLVVVLPSPRAPIPPESLAPSPCL